MSQTLKTSELAAELEACERRLAQAIAELTAFFEADLAAFVVRETRKAFLATPAIARRLRDEGQVSALKKRAAEAGAAAAATICAGLEEHAGWLAGPAESDDEKSLSALDTLWTHIRGIEATLGEVLDEAGLQTEVVPEYVAPRFFVNRRFFPALAEEYWKIRGELERLRGRRSEAEAEELRDELARVWDEA